MSGSPVHPRLCGRLAAAGFLLGAVHAPAARSASHEDPRLAGLLEFVGGLIGNPQGEVIWAGGALGLALLGFGFLIWRMIRRERGDGAGRVTQTDRHAGGIAPYIAPEPSSAPATAGAEGVAHIGRTEEAAPKRENPFDVMDSKATEERDLLAQDYFAQIDDDDWLGGGADHGNAIPTVRPTGEGFSHSEDADVVMRAETLMSQGLPDQAIAILLAYIREAEKPMPMAWLTLFDVFTRTGRRAQYEALASGFSALFNAITPTWQDLQSEGHKHLEDYPVVLGKVQQVWGLPNCRDFLELLLHDDRGGSRQGFLLTAYRDILFLIEIVDTLAAMTLEEEIRRAIGQRQSSSA